MAAVAITSWHLACRLPGISSPAAGQTETAPKILGIELDYAGPYFATPATIIRIDAVEGGPILRALGAAPAVQGAPYIWSVYGVRLVGRDGVVLRQYFYYPGGKPGPLLYLQVPLPGLAPTNPLPLLGREFQQELTRVLAGKGIKL